MYDGWIKLHRKLLENPIVMKDADHLAVWTYLLLMASHKEHRTLLGGKAITLKPGQLVTGRKKIGDTLGVNEHKVDRILKALKSEQMIEQQGTRSGSVITILRWNEYQDGEQPNEQHVSNERATSEQPLSTIQECKNVRKNNNTSKWASEFDDLWELYPKKHGKQDAKRHYLKARKDGVDPEAVRAGIIAYNRYIELTRTEDRYIKAGSSFFNQRAWENDWSVKMTLPPKSNVPQQPEPPKYRQFEPEPEVEGEVASREQIAEMKRKLSISLT